MKLKLLALVLALPAITLAEDYSTFSTLPEVERAKIVWKLRDTRQWGTPDLKPVCRDILEHQGYAGANFSAWTSEAIDLAAKYSWDELGPLIENILERPRDVSLFKHAFNYLRTRQRKPVAPEIIADAETLVSAGNQSKFVLDVNLQAAQARLINAPDKQAVLVYALEVAVRNSVKGGTDRGRIAAANVLATLDRGTVTRRLNQLRQDGESHVQDELEWVAKQLQITLISVEELKLARGFTVTGEMKKIIGMFSTYIHPGVGSEFELNLASLPKSQFAFLPKKPPFPGLPAYIPLHAPLIFDRIKMNSKGTGYSIIRLNSSDSGIKLVIEIKANEFERGGKVRIYFLLETYDHIQCMAEAEGVLK